MATKVLTIVGGISKDSLNRKTFAAMQEVAPSAMTLETFDISMLPFFTQDMENDPPPVVKEFKKKVSDADAVLFITPEYNRSFPGVLKNAIDWASRPYGQNLWNQKATAVMGASIGQIGTFGAQHHLRQVFAYLNMSTMGQPEFYLNGSTAFDKTGKWSNEESKKYAREFLEHFSRFIERRGL